MAAEHLTRRRAIGLLAAAAGLPLVLRASLATAEGGMGGSEAVPFADPARAAAFAAEHGGEVVAFDAIPADYVLGGQTGTEQPGEEAPGHGH